MRRTLIPALVFAVLLANAFTDGYFRDEFYYLACARHLAWGYVDHPPFSVALLAMVTTAFGDSLLVLRALAAVAGAVSVWLTGRIARRLGGGESAETIAMVAAAIAPVLIGTATFYSMNVLEILLWTVTADILIGTLDRPSTGRWLTLGVVLGIGLLNKLSVLWLGAGIAAALLLWHRSMLRTLGPWLAAAVAGLIVSPHVLWQIANGWPTLEFIRNASADKMQENSVVHFLVEQVTNLHPVSAPVWLTGLCFLLFARKARPYRGLACIYLVPLVILLANRTSRSGYLAPAYPLLLGAGGAALEPLLATPVRRVIAVGVIAAAGVVTLPLAVPLLPTERYVTYAASLGVSPSTEEKKDVGRLPQFFADRQGWPRMVATIEAAWDQLPPQERARAAVIVGNYGEAGAIEQLARGRDIRVISGHNNYWLWGPGDGQIDTFLVLSGSRKRQEQRFASVQQVGRIDCGDCMPYENGLTLFACRGLKQSLSDLWQELRHYD